MAKKEPKEVLGENFSESLSDEELFAGDVHQELSESEIFAGIVTPPVWQPLVL